MWNALDVILLCLIVQAAVTDLLLRKIPNVLILSGLLLAFCLHLLLGTSWALLHAWLAGMLAGFFLFLPLYLVRAMAAGDVKLMAMSGAFLGPQGALKVALLAYLLGGLLAVLMLVLVVPPGTRWRDSWRSNLCATARNIGHLLRPWLGRLVGLPLAPVPLDKSRSVGGMPYGVAVALATVTVVVCSPH